MSERVGCQLMSRGDQPSNDCMYDTSGVNLLVKTSESQSTGSPSHSLTLRNPSKKPLKAVRPAGQCHAVDPRPSNCPNQHISSQQGLFFTAPICTYNGEVTGKRACDMSDQTKPHNNTQTHTNAKHSIKLCVLCCVDPAAMLRPAAANVHC